MREKINNNDNDFNHDKLKENPFSILLDLIPNFMFTTEMLINYKSRISSETIKKTILGNIEKIKKIKSLFPKLNQDFNRNEDIVKYLKYLTDFCIIGEKLNENCDEKYLKDLYDNYEKLKPFMKIYKF